MLVRYKKLQILCFSPKKTSYQLVAALYVTARVAKYAQLICDATTAFTA